MVDPIKGPIQTTSEVLATFRDGTQVSLVQKASGDMQRIEAGEELVIKTADGKQIKGDQAMRYLGIAGTQTWNPGSWGTRCLKMLVPDGPLIEWHEATDHGDHIGVWTDGTPYHLALKIDSTLMGCSTEGLKTYLEKFCEAQDKSDLSLFKQAFEAGITYGIMADESYAFDVQKSLLMTEAQSLGTKLNQPPSNTDNTGTLAQLRDKIHFLDYNRERLSADEKNTLVKLCQQGYRSANQEMEKRLEKNPFDLDEYVKISELARSFAIFERNLANEEPLATEVKNKKTQQETVNAAKQMETKLAKINVAFLGAGIKKALENATANAGKEPSEEAAGTLQARIDTLRDLAKTHGLSDPELNRMFSEAEQPSLRQLLKSHTEAYNETAKVINTLISKLRILTELSTQFSVLENPTLVRLFLSEIKAVVGELSATQANAQALLTRAGKILSRIQPDPSNDASLQGPTCNLNFEGELGEEVSRNIHTMLFGGIDKKILPHSIGSIQVKPNGDLVFRGSSPIAGTLLDEQGKEIKPDGIPETVIRRDGSISVNGKKISLTLTPDTYLGLYQQLFAFSDEELPLE